MNNTNISINNKYIIENLIGKGKFGQIFKGHIYKKNTHIAIKMEPSEGEFKSIKHEVTILNYLYKRGCRNIPYIYWYGKYNLDICMVMNYFQGSLYRENIPQIDIFMIKCIDILKNIHEHYVIHRDIKPQNFMFDEHGELHLIDFGLATVYVDDNHRHIECTGCSQSYILGTPKYISFNVHEGYVPSRRDDLISVGYLYLFLKYGSLPWDNIGLFVSGSNDVGRSPESFVSFPPTSPSFTTGNIPNEGFSELHVLHSNNQFRKEKKEWSNISTYLSEIEEPEGFTPLNIINRTPEGRPVQCSSATLLVNELYQAPLKEGHPDSNLHGCTEPSFGEAEQNKIEKYLDYCYRMNFESEPNYSGLQQIFQLQ